MSDAGMKMIGFMTLLFVALGIVLYWLIKEVKNE